MSASAPTLYRPTLHQIRVWDRAQSDAQTFLAAVRTAVEHVAPLLAPEAAAELRQQVDASRPLSLPSREARYPLVRSVCDIGGRQNSPSGRRAGWQSCDPCSMAR